MLSSRRLALLLLAAVCVSSPALHAQSQAINGTIEGVVRDGHGRRPARRQREPCRTSTPASSGR
jgi:hypothetical protein